MSKFFINFFLLFLLLAPCSNLSAQTYSCGSVPINETKLCSFTVPDGNYTVSITQPEDVFSLSQTNISNRVDINFTPKSEKVFFAVIEIKDNFTNQITHVFLEGEGFSWRKIKINNQQNIGYVFTEDNPKVSFEVENLLELSTAYVLGDFSCELTYILPKEKVRCSTYLNYTGDKTGSFSKVFSVPVKVNDYENSITFYVYGTWAFPQISIEGDTEFGGVLVGESKTKMIKIINSGNYPLVVTYREDNPPFYFGEVSESVDTFAFFPIIFRPQSAGEFSKNITLWTNVGKIVLNPKGYGVSNRFPTLFSEKITVDFGVIIPGERKEIGINISNVGAQTLIVKDIYIPPNTPFSVGDLELPISLEPAENTKMPVLFNPKSEGEFTSYIELLTNDPERTRFRINISGKAYIPDISYTQRVDFNYIRIGYVAQKEIIISNEKPFPVILSELNFDKSDVFSYESVSTPIYLNYKDTITIHVIFSPKELTYYESSVKLSFLIPISSNYSFEQKTNVVEKNTTVIISGYGGYPYINLKSTEIDFGKIWSDETSVRIFPIENTGNTELDVKLKIDSDVFSLSAYDLKIAPGETFPLRVSFSPSGKSGTFISFLHIFSNDPIEPEKVVKIYGIANSPKTVLEGKGCSSFGIFILAPLFVMLILVAKNRIFKVLLFLIFLPISESFPMNQIFSPKSSYRLFLSSEPYFPAKRTISFSNTLYFSFGQLFRNTYKGDKLVESEEIIKSSVINDLTLSYAPSESYIIYADLPIGYFYGKEKGFFLSNVFFGSKLMLYRSEEGTTFFGDVFLSVPTGSEKVYLKSSPFSFGVIGGLKRNIFLANAGIIYGGEDIPPRGFLSSALSFNITKKMFNSYEGYILFPFEAKREFVSSELSVSLGIDLDEAKGKIGFSKGIIGGFGSSNFRVFISGEVDINPDTSPSVKYFEAKGIIVSESGEPVSNCTVKVKDFMISQIAKDGKFSINLPVGTHKIEAICKGYEVSHEYVSRKNPYVKIVVSRIQPTLIIHSTDKNAIPIERKIKVGFDGNEFDFETYYITLRGKKKFHIETDNFSEEIIMDNPNFVWLRLEEKKATEDEEDEKNSEVKSVETELREKTEEKKVEEESMEKEYEVKTKTGTSIGMKGEEKLTETKKKSQTESEKILSLLRQKGRYDIQAEENIILKTVISGFETNSYSIPKNGKIKLEELVNFISKNSHKIKEIIIEGHTDDIGTQEWNFELSYLRANEVRKYLFEKGILIPVKVIGYSSMFPLIRDNNPQAKSKNRRVEIKIFLK